MYIIKLKKIIPLFFASLFCIGANSAICPSGEFALTQEELITLKKAAIAGDLKAVNRVINYYGFYKNNREENRKWLAVGALLKDESAIHNLNVMKISIRKILLLSTQQEEALKNTDFQKDPSAAFFLYANFFLKGDIATANTTLRLIQDQKIKISSLLLEELAKLNKDDIQAK